MTSPDTLLHLPDEILLSIALTTSKFDEPNTQLRNLAFAHRRFAGIVREALVPNAIVPRHGISAYVDLLREHPEWATKIEELEVREFGRDFCESREADRDLIGIIAIHFAPDGDEKGLRFAKSLEVNERLKDREIRSLALLASLPNVKKLTLKFGEGFPPAWYFIVDAPAPWCNTLELQQIQSTLMNRLEEISIFRNSSADTRINNINVGTLSFWDMSTIKVLNIDKSYIQRWSDDWAGYVSPADKLPSNVETVRIFGVADDDPWGGLSQLLVQVSNQSAGPVKLQHLHHNILYLPSPYEETASLAFETFILLRRTVGHSMPVIWQAGHAACTLTNDQVHDTGRYEISDLIPAPRARPPKQQTKAAAAGCNVQ